VRDAGGLARRRRQLFRVASRAAGRRDGLARRLQPHLVGARHGRGPHRRTQPRRSDAELRKRDLPLTRRALR
jgi:hypothetical protein